MRVEFSFEQKERVICLEAEGELEKFFMKELRNACAKGATIKIGTEEIGDLEDGGPYTYIRVSI